MHTWPSEESLVRWIAPFPQNRCVPPHPTHSVLCFSLAVLPTTSASNSSSHPPHLGISALHLGHSRPWAWVMQKSLQDSMTGYRTAWLSFFARGMSYHTRFFPDRSHFCHSTMSHAFQGLGSQVWTPTLNTQCTFISSLEFVNCVRIEGLQ